MSTSNLPTGLSAPTPFATKAEVVYSEIRRQILAGVLAPGARLSQEALAVALNVSATPVREAVHRLLAEGLVELEAHKTVLVAPLSALELREIYEVRLRLDPYAARVATVNARDEDIVEIARLARVAPSKDGVEQLAVNRAFHRAIYVLCNNQYMINLLDRLWDQADRYRIVLLRSNVGMLAALGEHIQIAEAMQRREPEVVERLIQEHVTQARTGIEDALE